MRVVKPAFLQAGKHENPCEIQREQMRIRLFAGQTCAQRDGPLALRAHTSVDVDFESTDRSQGPASGDAERGVRGVLSVDVT